MSTKRLTRTVMEGGRTRWSKNARRGSHRVARARERVALHQLRRDPEAAIAPRPPPTTYKSFADKLGPAYRWLDKRVGRPWREVEGEILATFDATTLAGRHLVHDHLLPSVDVEGGWRRWSRYHVDEEGLFQKRLRRDVSPQAALWKARRLRPAVAAWVGARRVGERGARRYWLEPVRGPEAAVQVYRQGRALTAEESATFEGWPALARTDFVIDLDGPAV